MANIDSVIRQSIEKVLDERKLSPENRKQAAIVTDNLLKKTLPVMKEQLAWQRLKEIFIPIYQSSFSEKEINDLIVFYESPAGKAVIEKMPAVTLKTMAAANDLIISMTKEMEKGLIEVVNDLKVKNNRM
jgi:hypothetical protein